MRNRLGLLSLAAAGIAASPPPAAAQAPRGELGRFEVSGLDFRPDGGWRVRARQVRDARRALLRAGNFVALNSAREFTLRAAPGAAPASARALTGTVYAPVVLLAYSDVAVAYPTDQFRDVLFSATPADFGRPYTLKTYYEELSNGLITLTGRVFAPVRGDTNAAYYQDNCNGIGVLVTCPNGGRRFGALLVAALDSVSNRPGADTVWSQFDNDGPDGLPNSGDDDGVVDFVTFLQPTADGACGTSGVWAHRWTVRVWNNGSPYVTRTPRRGSNGQPIPGQFLVVDDYTIQSQLGGLSGCDATNIMPIGTVAHETGHIFGLPDLYDTDASSRTQGIGEWGLMGSGNFTRAYSPASYEAWSLAELGWVTLEPLTASRTVTTGARQRTDSVFIAQGNLPGHYVLLENRQAVGSDTAQMNPTYGKRKVPGLLVWLIDEDRVLAGLAPNQVNTGARQGVSLLQADGLNQLRTPGANNRGDPGDPFPGASANTRLGASTNPAARNNFGEYLGFIVDQVEQLAGEAMRFRFLRREPSLISSTLPGAMLQINGTTVARFDDVVPPGDPIMLDVGEQQVVNQGRTRARFLAWSDGGARAHTVVSGATPDTITASFTSEHRLQVLSQGGGSVVASPPGDLVTGVFFAEGAAVTLTAAPPSGVLFAGWEGDLAARDPVLRLTMSRPYDLLAVFVPDRQIPLDRATAEILGTATLTPEERSFLDTFGNRNGTFDLGDYLAFLQRQGLAPNPAVMARVAGPEVIR